MKFFKILLIGVLLCAFLSGALGMSMLVIVCSGVFLLITISIFYLIKKISIIIMSVFLKIYEIFKKPSQLRSWILFAIYTLLMIGPIIFDVLRRISWCSLYKHLYLVIIGGVLIGYILKHIMGKICIMYSAYKKMYSNENTFIIWGTKGNDDSIAFTDFLWNSYDVNKKSLIWIRRYALYFCYPVFLISYIICLTNNGNLLSSTVTLGSICIAMFSVWYSVNLGMKKNEEVSLNKQMENMEPSKKEAFNKKNNEWQNN